MTRVEFADLIFEQLLKEKKSLSNQYTNSRSEIGYFYIDNLLPEKNVKEIYEAFPKPEEMVLKKSIRENKYVASQMDLYNPILEEIIYAFQDDRIVELIGEICQLKNIYPDNYLYAGGISCMGNKQFLNPHLDNSHDKDRNRWRVLNLLFYVTPEWKEEYGGNLELWPNGLGNPQITIHSKFNRLAVMATHNDSLHSVSPVTYEGYRSCVSNYYFSDNPLKESDRFHVTSFRARPGKKMLDLILKFDSWARMKVRAVFKKGIVENKHVYKQPGNQE